jgi:hypothetical protein
MLFSAVPEIEKQTKITSMMRTDAEPNAALRRTAMASNEQNAWPPLPYSIK